MCEKYVPLFLVAETPYFKILKTPAARRLVGGVRVDAVDDLDAVPEDPDGEDGGDAGAVAEAQRLGVVSEVAGLLPTDGSDSRFVLDSELRYVSSIRFGLWTVPTTRAVRGVPEHSRTFSPDTVSTTLKNQRNSNAVAGQHLRVAPGPRQLLRGFITLFLSAK